MTALNWDKARNRAQRAMERWEDPPNMGTFISAGAAIKGMPMWARRDRNSPDCPLCGKRMKVRTRRADGQPFWGCPGYPGCKGTRAIGEVKVVVARTG